MSKQNRLPASEYDSYIKSNAWRAKRQRYFASKLPQKCLVCNDCKVHLHHRTYDRLGFEYLADLLPLCQKHHSECHDYIAKNKRSLKAGTNSYLRSKGARWHGPNGVNPSYKVAREKRKLKMPAYEYKCKDCGVTITIVRGIKDEEHKPICINCKKVMPRAYDSAPAVTFKGEGWGKD